jgi:hypothetical protein
MAVAFPKTSVLKQFKHSLTKAKETWRRERTQELHVDCHKKKLANTLKVSHRLFLHPTHSKPAKKKKMGGGRERKQFKMR